MRAIIVRRYGGPEVLEFVDVPTPEPAGGEVRIAVAAAAVNPVDIATRAGYLDHVVKGRLPIGVGWDLAGTVDAIGPGVAEFAVGDAVIALIDRVVGETGAYATHAVVPATAVARAPAGVDPVAAATLPLNALTAEQALDLLGLSAGQTLLVTGAAGALGEYAVTLGARRGLHIIGLARESDEAGVRAAGAADFVTNADQLTVAVDGALDAAGLVKDALAAVREGGAFIAVNDPSEPAAERGIAVQTVHVHHDGARLAQLAADVEAGLLNLRVAGTLPLAKAAEAHERVAAGGIRGRFVLVP
jgi:NADPH2:quinone reductase